jgi:hypothetical protein
VVFDRVFYEPKRSTSLYGFVTLQTYLRIGFYFLKRVHTFYKKWHVTLLVTRSLIGIAQKMSLEKNIRRSYIIIFVNDFY